MQNINPDQAYDPLHVHAYVHCLHGHGVHSTDMHAQLDRHETNHCGHDRAIISIL